MSVKLTSDRNSSYSAGTVYEGGWVDNLEHEYGIKINRAGHVQKGFRTLGELVLIEIS
ncbi:hypothetical protein [Paenibacillus gallinarum]|uniref:hypothetical protein n=1 Tax=Paenibacillus gallinarum TaxID=2762232 RepID=UPI00177F65D9|nr:hypothetical protein [Paenibacillus gallinarum]